MIINPHTGQPEGGVLTPQQNMQFHMQTRQQLMELAKSFQETVYRQTLFMEYVVHRLEESGISIDGQAAQEWMEKRHTEIQAEFAKELEAQTKSVSDEAIANIQAVLKNAKPINLEE